MIVLQCDDLYVKWLLLFLKSFKAFHSDLPIYISIFNGSESMKDECLNLVPHAHIDLDNQNRYALPLMEHSMRECMTVRKAYVLADVIEEFQPHWVLMLDVDTLCRKNLMPWINSLLETKVAMAIVKNDGLVDHPRRFQSQYSASLIFLASSAFHVAFQWHYFIQTPKKMMGYDSFQYFWDQVALYATVSQFEDELNICYLAADLFVDEAFSNAAYFWTWGTVVEGAKLSIYLFFKEFCTGKKMTQTRRKFYMSQFFDKELYRECYVFAHAILQSDPHDQLAIFCLAVIYLKALNQPELARKMFSALIDVGYNVQECQAYLGQT